MHLSSSAPGVRTSSERPHDPRRSPCFCGEARQQHVIEGVQGICEQVDSLAAARGVARSAILHTCVDQSQAALRVRRRAVLFLAFPAALGRKSWYSLGLDHGADGVITAGPSVRNQLRCRGTFSAVSTTGGGVFFCHNSVRRGAWP